MASRLSRRRVKAIKRRLRLIAEQKGSQRGLAKELDVSPGLVATWVDDTAQNTTLPGSEKLVLLMDRMGVNLNWLLSAPDGPTKSEENAWPIERVERLREELHDYCWRLTLDHVEERQRQLRNDRIAYEHELEVLAWIRHEVQNDFLHLLEGQLIGLANRAISRGQRLTNARDARWWRMGAPPHLEKQRLELWRDVPTE